MSAAFRSRFSLSKPKDKPTTAAAAAMMAPATHPDLKESSKGLRGTRRRLSVVSDNKLIEGIATLGVDDERKTEEHHPEHVIKMYAGVSKKVCRLPVPRLCHVVRSRRGAAWFSHTLAVRVPPSGFVLVAGGGVFPCPMLLAA